MKEVYIQLALVALLPAAVSVVFCLLEEKTAFGRLKYITRQIIIGVVFGLVAVLGTEKGIPANGAVLNARDAAPICAGLLFGPAAGVISGLIGGIERWIAVYWGVGSFTRVACTVSTAAAGITAGALRKKLFDDERPTWLLTMTTGLVIEVFHITMVFVTNLKQAEKAFEIVKLCALPMISAVTLGCGAAGLLAAAIDSKEAYERRRAGAEKEKAGVSRIIQKGLLFCVSIAFIITTVFMLTFQNGVSENQAETLLRLGISDLIQDIKDVSDSNLLRVTRSVSEDLDSGTLWELAAIHSVAEINVADDQGIIRESTNPSFIGYDLASGEQSAEFLVLLNGEKEYVQDYGPIAKDPSILRKYAAVALPEGGLVQVGYNARNFQADIAKQVETAANNRHIGESGFLVIIDSDGKVRSGPKRYLGQSASECGLDMAFGSEERLTVFQGIIEDTSYRCMYDTSEGYTIVGLLSADEAFEAVELSLYLNSFLEILVFAAIFVLIFLLVKNSVLDNVGRVNSLLERITKGDLDTVVDVRGNREFASLSSGINATVDTLKHYIAEAEARIDQELELAREIQHSALPEVFPAFPGRKEFDIYASMTAAKEVGGDFYDFYFTGEDRFNFLAADVSGKGIPAAMFMMRAKTLLKSLRESGLAVNDVFVRGNNGLCEGNDSQMFVTSWMASVDLATGKMESANAGHNPPLIRHKDGEFEYFRTPPGLVLGGMAGMKYRLSEYALAPGDVVFLYTDGVTEATNAQNELYGEERLKSILNAAEYASSEEICAAVKADIDLFAADAPQFDDITMVAFRFLGKPPKKNISFEKAEIDDITSITEYAEEVLELLDCPMKAQVQINIAIDEIYSNIVKYAYKDGSGPAEVSFTELSDPHGVLITFTDEGIPYNPMNKEDPDTTLALEDREIGGLGIFMVKRSMDEMYYEYRDGKNILSLKKYF